MNVLLGSVKAKKKFTPAWLYAVTDKKHDYEKGIEKIKTTYVIIRASNIYSADDRAKNKYKWPLWVTLESGPATTQKQLDKMKKKAKILREKNKGEKIYKLPEF